MGNALLPFMEFQLTSSQGGRPRYWKQTAKRTHFNSHPHKEDDKQGQWVVTIRKHFNSHPHKEDDRVDMKL